MPAGVFFILGNVVSLLRCAGNHLRRLFSSLNPHRCARLAGTKSRAVEALTRGRNRQRNGRRRDHREVDAGAGKQRRDWRTEGRVNRRLVCRAAFGHGEYLQAVRREFQERRASANDYGRSAADRESIVGVSGSSHFRETPPVIIDTEVFPFSE